MSEPYNAPPLPVLDSNYYKYLLGQPQSVCTSLIKDLDWWSCNKLSLKRYAHLMLQFNREYY